MRLRTEFLLVAALLVAFAFTPSLHAQPLVNIETVTVGDAGNAADTTGYGAVAYEFNIGKYEVTIGQYTTFLNSVASVTSNDYLIDLWNPAMASNLNIAGISRAGSGSVADPYSYSVVGSGNRPIAYVSFMDAARFANWMNNGATNGASTESGAYTLVNGQTGGQVPQRSAGATWWIPTESEWVKAAFYKGGGTNTGYWLYATQSDVAPGNTIGGNPNQANYRRINVFSVTQSTVQDANQNYLTDIGSYSNSGSPYGTFDQGGNLQEWNDTDGPPSGGRAVRGGEWNNNDFDLRSTTRNFGNNDHENSLIGFRMATVPEPSTYALLLMTGAGALWWARRRR